MSNGGAGAVAGPVPSSSGGSRGPAIAERGLEASSSRNDSFKFQLEDTQEGCYRDISSYLSKLGWKRMPIRKKSKLEKKLPLRKEEVPLLYWVLNERDVDFTSLAPHQVCNHFEGLGRTLTTKSGLCDLLREMDWMSTDCNTISPRCYNLGDPVQREEFMDDFRLSAATNILKWVQVAETEGLDGSVVPKGAVGNAMKVCARYLRVKVGGEWPGVDRGFKNPEGTSGLLGLTDSEWTQLLEASYRVADKSFRWHPDMLASAKIALLSKSGPAFKTRVKIWLLLNSLSKISRQMMIDGTKNIWVIKAPEACKGVGIKLLYKLTDILECEKGMGGRTAQKYIENPLLAPFNNKGICEGISPRGPSLLVSPTSQFVKFDLRVWVLVTSVTPLRAKVYSRVYGRSCCLPYSDELSTLSDTSMHLTNFAIQKNCAQNDLPNSGSGSSSASEPGGSSLSAINRPRTTGSLGSRGSDTSAKERDGALSKADLLVSQEQVIQIVSEASEEILMTKTCGGERKTWDSFVWPGIKDKITSTLQAVCCSGNVTQRERSFELLGFDIMLDGDLNPWILEVNMSPALAHRETQQSDLIAHMAAGLVDLAIISRTGKPTIVEPPVQGTFDGNDSSAAPRTVTPSVEIDQSLFGQWEELYNTDASCSLPPYLARNIVSESLPEKAVGRRPASAGRLRPNQKLVKIPDWDDVQYTAVRPAPPAPLEAVGRAISLSSLRKVDENLDILRKMRLIQAWFRRFLARTRRFHLRRDVSSVLAQRVIRGFLGKRRLWHLRRHYASMMIQCWVRCLSARKRCIALRVFFAALKFQCCVRMHQARLVHRKLHLNACAHLIQRSLQKSMDRWRRKAAFKIVALARIWVKRRWQQARKIRNIIAWYYHRRSRCAKVIQGFVRRCFVRWRLFDTMRKMKLSALATEAAAEVEMKLKLKMELLQRQEREEEEIRVAVSVLIETLVSTVEKIDEEGRERMNRNNSGFLFDFVDRYEVDRRRVLASLPSVQGLRPCGGLGGDYEFEDAPPTTYDSELDDSEPVGFKFEPPKVSLVRSADTRALSLKITQTGINNLSRIGAEAMEREKHKGEKYRRTSGSRGREQMFPPVSSRGTPSNQQIGCGQNGVSDREVPKFIEIPIRPSHSSREKVGKRRVDKEKEIAPDTRGIPQPPPIATKKAARKKKQKGRTALCAPTHVNNAFDTSRPPEFSNFSILPLPPSAPLSKPPSMARPDNGLTDRRGNTRPHTSSAVRANRRTEYLKAHEKDYLEALRSVNMDLEAAAAHYSHHGDREEERNRVREPLVTLHLSHPSQSISSARYTHTQAQGQGTVSFVGVTSGKGTEKKSDRRPEFAINKIDYAVPDLPEKNRPQRTRPPQGLGLPGRPQSASAVGRSDGESHVKSAGRLRDKGEYNWGREELASNRKIVISLEKPVHESTVTGGETGDVFAAFRESYDYSDFKIPSFNILDETPNSRNDFDFEI